MLWLFVHYVGVNHGIIEILTKQVLLANTAAEVDPVPSTSTPKKRSDNDSMVPLHRFGFRIADYYSLQEENPLPAAPLETQASPELVDLTTETDDEAVEIQEDLQNIADYIERQLEEENH